MYSRNISSIETSDNHHISYAYLSHVKPMPMTQNTGLWLDESNKTRYEYWWEHISYAYLSNVK